METDAAPIVALEAAFYLSALQVVTRLELPLPAMIACPPRDVAQNKGVSLLPARLQALLRRLVEDEAITEMVVLRTNEDQPLAVTDLVLNLPAVGVGDHPHLSLLRLVQSAQAVAGTPYVDAELDDDPEVLLRLWGIALTDPEVR